ncbi:MAG: hypothetical protein KAV87_25910, partial [Desulfobacteraceae bacterium]|nr:hypothetical protein [Desulfobacteraceae bacterium]
KLFLSTWRGVFLSTDNGLNWIPANSGLPADISVSCLAARGADLFAGTFDHGVFLSMDKGKSWRAVSSGLPENIDIWYLAVSARSLLAVAGDEVGYLFLSRDDGRSWTRVASGLPERTAVIDLVASGSNFFVVTKGGSGIIISPGTDAIQRVSMGCGVFSSSDGGTNWTEVGPGLPADTPVSCLAVSGTILFAGTWGNGVFVSTDNGTSWTPANSGLMYARIHDLVATEEYLFAGTLGRGAWRLALSDLSIEK